MFPGERTNIRLRCPSVLSERFEEEGIASAPDKVPDFADRLACFVPSGPPGSAPLPERIAKCLERGFQGVEVARYPLRVLPMTGSQLARLYEVVEYAWWALSCMPVDAQCC